MGSSGLISNLKRSKFRSFFDNFHHKAYVDYVYGKKLSSKSALKNPSISNPECIAEKPPLLGIHSGESKIRSSPRSHKNITDKTERSTSTSSKHTQNHSDKRLKHTKTRIPVMCRKEPGNLHGKQSSSASHKKCPSHNRRSQKRKESINNNKITLTEASSLCKCSSIKSKENVFNRTDTKSSTVQIGVQKTNADRDKTKSSKSEISIPSALCKKGDNAIISGNKNRRRKQHMLLKMLLQDLKAEEFPELEKYDLTDTCSVSVSKGNLSINNTERIVQSRSPFTTYNFTQISRETDNLINSYKNTTNSYSNAICHCKKDPNKHLNHIQGNKKSCSQWKNKINENKSKLSLRHGYNFHKIRTKGASERNHNLGDFFDDCKRYYCNNCLEDIKSRKMEVISEENTLQLRHCKRDNNFQRQNYKSGISSAPKVNLNVRRRKVSGISFGIGIKRRSLSLPDLRTDTFEYKSKSNIAYQGYSNDTGIKKFCDCVDSVNKNEIANKSIRCDFTTPCKLPKEPSLSKVCNCYTDSFQYQDQWVPQGTYRKYSVNPVFVDYTRPALDNCQFDSATNSYSNCKESRSNYLNCPSSRVSKVKRNSDNVFLHHISSTHSLCHSSVSHSDQNHYELPHGWKRLDRNYYLENISKNIQIENYLTQTFPKKSENEILVSFWEPNELTENHQSKISQSSEERIVHLQERNEGDNFDETQTADSLIKRSDPLIESDLPIPVDNIPIYSSSSNLDSVFTKELSTTSTSSCLCKTSGFKVPTDGNSQLKEYKHNFNVIEVQPLRTKKRSTLIAEHPKKKFQYVEKLAPSIERVSTGNSKLNQALTNNITIKESNSIPDEVLNLQKTVRKNVELQNCEVQTDKLLVPLCKICKSDMCKRLKTTHQILVKSTIRKERIKKELERSRDKKVSQENQASFNDAVVSSIDERQFCLNSTINVPKDNLVQKKETKQILIDEKTLPTQQDQEHKGSDDMTLKHQEILHPGIQNNTESHAYKLMDRETKQSTELSTDITSKDTIHISNENSSQSLNESSKTNHFIITNSLILSKETELEETVECYQIVPDHVTDSLSVLKHEQIVENKSSPRVVQRCLPLSLKNITEMEESGTACSTLKDDNVGDYNRRSHQTAGSEMLTLFSSMNENLVNYDQIQSFQPTEETKLPLLLMKFENKSDNRSQSFHHLQETDSSVFLTQSQEKNLESTKKINGVQNTCHLEEFKTSHFISERKPTDNTHDFCHLEEYKTKKEDLYMCKVSDNSNNDLHKIDCFNGTSIQRYQKLEQQRKSHLLTKPADEDVNISRSERHDILPLRGLNVNETGRSSDQKHSELKTNQLSVNSECNVGESVCNILKIKQKNRSLKDLQNVNLNQKISESCVGNMNKLSNAFSIRKCDEASKELISGTPNLLEAERLRDSGFKIDKEITCMKPKEKDLGHATKDYAINERSLSIAEIDLKKNHMLLNDIKCANLKKKVAPNVDEKTIGSEGEWNNMPPTKKCEYYSETDKKLPTIKAAVLSTELLKDSIYNILQQKIKFDLPSKDKGTDESGSWSPVSVPVHEKQPPLPKETRNAILAMLSKELYERKSDNLKKCPRTHNTRTQTSLLGTTSSSTSSSIKNIKSKLLNNSCQSLYDKKRGMIKKRCIPCMYYIPHSHKKQRAKSLHKSETRRNYKSNELINGQRSQRLGSFGRWIPSPFERTKRIEILDPIPEKRSEELILQMMNPQRSNKSSVYRIEKEDDELVCEEPFLRLMEPQRRIRDNIKLKTG